MEADPVNIDQKVIASATPLPRPEDKQELENIEKTTSKASHSKGAPSTLTTKEYRLSDEASSSSEADLEKASSKPTSDQPQTVHGNDEPEYPTTKKLIPIVISLYLAFFLVALDRTIIATAIPTITDRFHSIGDIGWYASAYMLTLCAFQLLFGRIYTFYSPKIVFLTAIFLFEVGSAICGAASK